MLQLVARAGLTESIRVDSAGTAAYHVGSPADRRSAAAAARRGITLAGSARQFQVSDFEAFDYLLALDASNLRDLRRLASSDSQRAQVQLLRNYDPSAPAGASVPDPYYGGERGFEEVLDICERACTALLGDLRAEHGFN